MNKYDELMETPEFYEELAVGKAQELIAKYSPNKMLQRCDDMMLTAVANQLWKAGYELEFSVKPINQESKNES